MADRLLAKALKKNEIKLKDFSKLSLYIEIVNCKIVQIFVHLTCLKTALENIFAIIRVEMTSYSSLLGMVPAYLLQL